MDMENRLDIDPLYLDGRHYDRLFSNTGEDTAFWIEQAHPYGNTILELGCGTGKFAIPLAKAGFEVTGLDYSAGMLKEAQRKAGEEKISIEWVQQDMRHFKLGKRFDFIFLPANAICHLHELDDLEGCFDRVKSHLKPTGRFALDVFVPQMDLLVDQPDVRLPFAAYDDPDGEGKVMVTHSYTYESDRQIKRIRTYHSWLTTGKKREGELNLRIYFPKELEALLRYNGFRIAHKYGSYAASPFGQESEKQIFICTVYQGI